LIWSLLIFCAPAITGCLPLRRINRAADGFLGFGGKLEQWSDDSRISEEGQPLDLLASAENRHLSATGASASILPAE
jgi:hypothetical protein